MKEQEAIDYIESLEPGEYMTVNIPLLGHDSIPVTVMYVGKDKLNRYNFIDTGKFTLSKDFIERGKISIDKEFNRETADEIYQKVLMAKEKNNKKQKNRDAR